MSMSTPEPLPPLGLREFLQRWPWYRALSAELRSLVLNTAVERTVGPGDYIARSGEPSAHWYGLMHGFLQMYVVGSDGAETTLYCMREGEWGGEGSLLKREMRRYDLRSLTLSHLCLIPAETFEALRQSSIEFQPLPVRQHERAHGRICRNARGVSPASTRDAVGACPPDADG